MSTFYKQKIGCINRLKEEGIVGLYKIIKNKFAIWILTEVESMLGTQTAITKNKFYGGEKTTALYSRLSRDDEYA